MRADPEKTARGALAGATAAAVWAAAAPVDVRVFGVRYLDEELLGKAVTRGPAWRTVGVALHLLNGAVFGALYANVAARVPLPPWLRGPAAGVAEHLATWPLTALTDRVHPARDELPALFGDPRAFAQSAWRHLLFGAVLGELERRLNPPRRDPLADFEHVLSRNGHGDLEHAVGAAG